MSLPRIAAVVLQIVVLVSWAAEQFFDLPYEHFDALAGGARDLGIVCI
jgi:flagellar biosynthesis protein FliQ